MSVANSFCDMPLPKYNDLKNCPNLSSACTLYTIHETSVYWSEGMYTVKKAVEFLDAPSKNTFLKSNKYNSIVEIVYLDTHVFFSPLCYQLRKFDIREIIILYQYRSKAYLFNNEKL